MPVEVKFSCGHRIGVAYVDACTQMVCPFCAAKPKPAPEGGEIKPPPPSCLRNCVLESKGETLFSDYETPFGRVWVANLDGYKITPLDSHEPQSRSE